MTSLRHTVYCLSKAALGRQTPSGWPAAQAHTAHQEPEARAMQDARAKEDQRRAR